jgi:ribosome biogenesis protein Nip4
MMKPVEDFVKRFKASVDLDKSFIVSKQDRYFLVNERLRGLIQEDFFYAGTYLGKVKRGIFFPSFILLTMLARGKSNKIVVDDKTAWLFICGRDVFKRGAQSVLGSARKGDHALIVNRHDECLGFGRILHNIDEIREKDKVVVKNISDIGDFLRREK